MTRDSMEPHSGAGLPSLTASDAEAIMRRGVEMLATRSRQVLDAIAEGVYLLDPTGHTLFVNEEGARLLGYSPRELAGQPQHTMIHYNHPDGSPHPIEECPIWLAGTEGIQQRVGGDVFWRKDGTALPVEYTAIPIRDGRTIIGTVVTFRDVSGRAEAERQASTLEREKTARSRAERGLEELQRLLAQAPAAISMTRGPEHRYVYQNELARRLSRRDMIGRTAAEVYPELSGQGILELLDRVYATGEAYVGNTVVIRWDRDGSGEPRDGCFDFILQPVRDDDGRITGLLSHSVEVQDPERCRVAFAEAARRRAEPAHAREEDSEEDSEEAPEA